MSVDAQSLAAAIAEARPKVVAGLAVHLRDLDLAEDAFAEAAEACLSLGERPRNVAGWLHVAGKRKAIDAIRKREAEQRAVDGAAEVSDMNLETNPDTDNVIELPEAIPDERLRLIFICCHPALSLEARAGLALKVICGVPVAQIARVFLTTEPTMYQRIARAKRKVREAGIAFELPPRKAWGERLDAVLLTLELAYTIAYQDAGGEVDPELASEVARLAAMVAELLPREPEALGLASLVWLAHSRNNAREDADGTMVPLSRQNIRLWNGRMIEQARQWMDQAAALQSSGPYQLMAAIHLTHARRFHGGETDWAAIVRLYDALMVVRPGPIVLINRALALAKVEGAEAALAQIEALDVAALDNSRSFHVARAELLAQLSRREDARAALGRALECDPPRAERLFLEQKLARL